MAPSPDQANSSRGREQSHRSASSPLALTAGKRRSRIGLPPQRAGRQDSTRVSNTHVQANPADGLSKSGLLL